jgi:hypothetical protein
MVVESSTDFLEEEIPLEERKANAEKAKKRAEDYEKNIRPIAEYGIVKPTPVVFENAYDPTPPYYLNYINSSTSLLPEIDEEDIPDDEMSPLKVMHLTNNDIHDLRNPEPKMTTE